MGRLLGQILGGLALAGTVVHPKVGGICFYLMACLGLGAFIRFPSVALSVLMKNKRLCMAFLVPAGIQLCSILMFGLAPRDFVFAPLLVAPLLVVFFDFWRVTVRSIAFGCAVGVVVATVVVVFDFVSTGAERPTGNLNAIVFAHVILTFILYTYLSFLLEPDRELRLMFLLVSFLGVSLILVSGTRGAILVLPIAAIACHVGLPVRLRSFSRNWGLSRSLIFALFVGMAVVGLKFDSAGRFEKIYQEVEAYQQGDIGNRSVALRLALWKAALEMVAERPVMGAGATNFRRELERLQADGRYPEDAAIFPNSHSTPLSILAQYGVVGAVAASLALFLLWTAFRKGQPDQQTLGIAMILTWLGLGLTSDILAHQALLRTLTLGFVACAMAVGASKR